MRCPRRRCRGGYVAQQWHQQSGDVDITGGRAPAMRSTLGDLLREVAEPGPNRNSFHSTAHFPSGIARARARGVVLLIVLPLTGPLMTMLLFALVLWLWLQLMPMAVQSPPLRPKRRVP